MMGPLLYLLFVGDLPNIVTNETKIFVDDTKIWGPVKNVEDGRSFSKATSPNSANNGHRGGNYCTTWTSVNASIKINQQRNATAGVYIYTQQMT